MRILVCEFHQESNSFNPVLTTRQDYELHGILEGNGLLETNRDTRTLLGGIYSVLEEHRAEIVSACGMWCDSGGPVEHAVVTEFLEKTEAVIRGKQPFDGACVSLHGATQSTEMEDVCGYILEVLRERLGPKAVIAAGFDLHANITEKIRRSADYVCGYQTYPHVDFYETGCRTARLCLRALEGGGETAVVYSAAPMIVSASAYTTRHGEFKKLMDYGKELVAQKELIDFSVFQAQPWLDVACCAGAVVSVAARDTAAAALYAGGLIRRLWSIRYSMKENLLPIEEIIALGERNNTGRPILLIDSSDSVNAGACGDSAAVLQAILKTGSSVKAAIPVIDVPAVKKAFQVGVGNTAVFSIGATKDTASSQPVVVTAKVRSLHDGSFINEGPAMAGSDNSLGKTAVLRIGMVDVLVSSVVTHPGDPQFYRNFGIEPLFYQMLVIKACTSYRAAFEPLAQQIYYADTPGAAALNLRRLPFAHVPKSYYPFADSGTCEGAAYSPQGEKI